MTFRKPRLLLVLCASLAFAGTTRAQDNRDGILGDAFATESGAIVVTGERLGSNLFEAVEIPETSCLAGAPEVGSDTPGFVIDATGFKRVRDLERVRKRTRAGTIYVSGAKLVGADMRKADLHDMCFFASDLSQTDWTGFEGSGLGFVDTDLTGAKMARAMLPYVLFRSVKLAEVDARQADFSNGQMDGSWTGSVRNLDLSGANLTGFRIRCGESDVDGCPAEREGVVLAGANLRRASLYDFYLPGTDFSGATIDQTERSLDYLPKLAGARLVGPVVIRSDRRAIMLFPGEVERMADAHSGEAANDADPCSQPVVGALAILCAQPGSETRALLRSVANLEENARGQGGYAERARAWAETRDACLEVAEEDPRIACLASAYRSRQTELREGAGAPGWLTRPGYRLFVSSEAAFETASGQPGLYGRILPILLDAASAAVIVRVEENGAASARGIAAGGCSFDAYGLSFVAQTGTLNLTTVAGRGRRARRVPGDALLSFAGGDATVAPEAVASMDSCAAEADAFPRLRNIELDDDLLADIYLRF